MKVELIENKSAFKEFEKVSSNIYRNNLYYRGTESSVEKMLLNSKSAFQKHAKILKFIVRDGNDLVARFALIQDFKLKNYVQVSYFEAQKGLGDIFSVIKNEIYKYFPDAKNVVVGLNAHLNYGAGILLNRFDEVPLFGLPYNPDYYADYFKDLTPRKMVTYRFGMDAYSAWAQTYNAGKIDGLTLRFMNKQKIKEESAIYTQLNNLSFQKHPFWANRDDAEDLELFYPFRFLLDDENLVFAEVKGKPVGFFLWYPDFNELVSTHRDLNILDVIKHRMGKLTKTYRFTEIGIVPEYQGTSVAMAMLNKALPIMHERNYETCEGGFIFEENLASIALVKRMMKRSYGYEPEPYRQFAVFETKL